MNRLSAAKAAFQNPERMTNSFTIVNMAPDMPRPLTEDQTEAEKQTAQMIYQRFVEAMEEMPEKNDRAMDYGMKLISAQLPDKQSFLHYSLLWPLFYAGYKEGLKDNDSVNPVDTDAFKLSYEEEWIIKHYRGADQPIKDGIYKILLSFDEKIIQFPQKDAAQQ